VPNMFDMQPFGGLGLPFHAPALLALMGVLDAHLEGRLNFRNREHFHG
jgi:hypothetical protein